MRSDITKGPGSDGDGGSPGPRMRLQRFLARAGVASRRRCESIITDGRVSVNGVVVTELGTKVIPGVDVVELDGEVVDGRGDATPTVIMLNKPKGFITAMSSAKGRRDRVAAELVPVRDHPGLFPVGRLDRDTTGLLLFTDDGDLGNALTHPSHGVEKRYIAHVEGTLDDDALQRLENGVELEDGMTSPAACEIVSTDADGTQDVSLTIHEGRKRQVRRMMSAVGHDVIDLERVRFGPISLDGLELGAWRELGEDEIRSLCRECGHPYVYN